MIFGLFFAAGTVCLAFLIYFMNEGNEDGVVGLLFVSMIILFGFGALMHQGSKPVQCEPVKELSK